MVTPQTPGLPGALYPRIALYLLAFPIFPKVALYYFKSPHICCENLIEPENTFYKDVSLSLYRY